MTTHSEKAMQTMAAMATVAADWKGADYVVTRERRMVSGEVTCPTCKGDRYICRDAAGEIIPPPSSKDNYKAWQEYHAKAREGARATGFWGNCPRCMGTRGRSRGYCSGKVTGLVEREVWVARPVIPAGSVNDSRFQGGCTCGLCNKTVLKSNLWCVIATGADGRKHHMYIGEDCMKKFIPGATTFIKDPAGKKIARADLQLDSAAE